jgi:putative copper export protein/mono/diheme cytochrome c family protein
MSGRPLAGLFQEDVVTTVLMQTRFGHSFLLRAVLLGSLIPFLARFGKSRRSDELAALLGAASLAGLAWQGHAGAEEGVLGLVHVGADAAHLVAAGGWVGMLLPLALLLAESGHDGDRRATMVADSAVTAFSDLGLSCVAALAVTGVLNAWLLVGSVPALIGTTYGQILLAKLGLFFVMLGLATINRTRLAPRIAGPGRKTRISIALIRRNALIEAATGMAVIALVGALGTLVPGAHEQPWWPLPYRFGFDALRIDPQLRKDAIGTALLATSGLGLLAVGLRRRQALLIVTGLVLCLGLGWRPIQLLLIPATPTSYYVSTANFTVGSIDDGAKIYAQNCVSCHGERGQGDGAQAADLPIAPADLTAPHLFFHSDGDLFWFIGKGLDDGVMPGFESLLDTQQRWDVSNFIKARAGAATDPIGATVTANAAPLAPDFAFAAPVGTPGNLRSLLAEQAVLLLVEAGTPTLAAAFEDQRAALAQSGVAVLSADTPALRAAYGLYDYDRQPEPEIISPVAFLIDRDGYIRARWHPGDQPDWLNISALTDEIAAMTRLKLEPAALRSGHVH